jgi:DNA-binding GntR family transcriptional regulator
LSTIYRRQTTTFFFKGCEMASITPQLEPLHVPNLRDHIIQRIRSAILEGTYKLGGRLVESAIADQLGVSRAPVREALATLEQEGIVTKVPRRGYFVVDFSDKDVEELYSLRLLLEIEALRRVIGRASEQDLAEMQCLVNDLGEAAIQKSDPETIVALDMAFHEHICRLAGHSRLYSAWDGLRLQTQLLIGLTSRTHYDHPDQPREWHQRILDAVRAKNLECAEAILTDHVLDAQQRARASLHALRVPESEELA